MTPDGSEPKLSGVSITFSDMSFVEDNSLGNALRYARMMHGDSFLDQAGPGISLSLTRTAQRPVSLA